MAFDLLIQGNGKVELDTSPSFNFPFHKVGTEYFEFSYNSSVGGSYNYSLPPVSPSVRQFTLFFETMRYYFNSDGSVNVDAAPEMNMGRLEYLYNLHKLAVPFLYEHPLFGKTWVTFNSPLKVSRGREAGFGWLEPFSITLVEKPLNTINNSSSITFGERDFDFPYHLREHQYISLSTVVPLGGSYSYRVSPTSPEQRTFTLIFKTMQFLLDSAGLIDISSNAQLNAGRLLAFYNQYKLHRTFIYPHPDFGNIRVRFNKPLRFPEGLTNGRGYLPSFEVELIEVITQTISKTSVVDPYKFLLVNNNAGNKLLLINGKYFRVRSE